MKFSNLTIRHFFNLYPTQTNVKYYEYELICGFNFDTNRNLISVHSPI